MQDLTQFSRRTVLLMPLALAACKSAPTTIELSGLTMGTTYNVIAIPSGTEVSRADAQAAVDAALDQVNARMSNWMADSEISRFNANAGTGETALSPELAEVMQAAEVVHLASEGTFDTTMGPLIELWGFGARGTQSMPADAQIDTALARAGHGNTLRVGASSMAKKQSDAQVYLAAIGKGYGADHIGRALESLGIKDYLVEIGGDLYAAGRNADGTPWQIGVETPDAHDRAMLDVIGASGLGLASSGDYRNYFEKDGQRYSHVIDPTTGRPITHKTASATVLADNAMLADAWATAMLTLGRERGMEIAEAHNVGVMFVERAAPGAARRFEIAKSSAFMRLTA